MVRASGGPDSWGRYGWRGNTRHRGDTLSDKTQTSAEDREFGIAMVSIGVSVLIAIAALIATGYIGLFVLEYGWVPLRSLPTDQEMIEHFRKHREDFEALAKQLREDPNLRTIRGAICFEKARPSMRRRMERVQSYCLCSDHELWIPPDPYSGSVKAQAPKYPFSAKDVSSLPEPRRYTGVIFSYEHQPVERWDERYYTRVRKAYYYTPFPAKVENGLLIGPPGGPVSKRIYGALDTWPPGLQLGGRVYKQYEPQWFLRLCQSQ